jgi:hypothetical protein
MNECIFCVWLEEQVTDGAMAAGVAERANHLYADVVAAACVPEGHGDGLVDHVGDALGGEADHLGG